MYKNNSDQIGLLETETETLRAEYLRARCHTLFSSLMHQCLKLVTFYLSLSLSLSLCLTPLSLTLSLTRCLHLDLGPDQELDLGLDLDLNPKV